MPFIYYVIKWLFVTMVFDKFLIFCAVYTYSK